MNSLRRCLPSSMLAFLVSACMAEPPSRHLIGSWLTPPEDLSPAGWYETELSFNVYGVFHSEVRSYGLGLGQERNDLSSYARIEGTYRVEDDRLIFEPKRLVWWDSFYGGNSPEQVEEPYGGPVFDDAHYTLQNDILRLQYVSYPFDAPVSTSQEFARTD